MSALSDAIRQSWLSGINEVTGNIDERLTSWISNQNYQIYSDLTQDSFNLYVSDTLPILSAFASDCNRMAIAAFESIQGIQPNLEFPKSIGWLVIRLYYSAFYSAHAILRLMGTNLTQLEFEQTSSINKIGDLFGYLKDDKVTRGFYECKFDVNSKKLIGNKLNLSSGGSHEALWKIFHDNLREISNKVLTAPGLTVDRQQASNIISDICENLSYGPCGGNKNWLSFIRNKVTYKHEYGIWFPYREYARYYSRLFNILYSWQSDPIEIKFYKQPGRDLQRFLETCCTVIGLLKTTVIDMSSRCPNGKSFLSFGSLAFLKRAKVPIY